jgi:hypothetical protein
MSKSKQTNKLKGPNGEKLDVAWMDDGRIKICLSGKVAISAIYPGKGTVPEVKIIIQPVKL